MAEISNSDLQAADLSMEGVFRQEDAPMIKKGSSEFIAVDIGSLSAIAEKDSNSSPRIIRSISRKGYQRPAEKKTADGDAVSAAGGAHPMTPRIAVSGHVASIEEAVLLSHEPSPAAAGGKMRRLGSAGRRASPWLDPRRVMFIFATLSSMGTLILLYFTLSMGKMTGSDDANAQ